MDEEKHPIGEFLDINKDAIASLYLYEHPQKFTPITMYEMESYLCELIDEGMRKRFEIIQMMQDERNGGFYKAPRCVKCGAINDRLDASHLCTKCYKEMKE